MRLIYIAAACLFLALTSCNNGANTKTATTDSTKTAEKPIIRRPQSKLNETGTADLMAVVSKYYDLKNALVATNADDASKAAIQLITATDSLQAFLQKDSSNKTAFSPYLDTIKTQSKAITSMMDEDCEHFRIYFDHISSALYGLAKTANLKNAGIYRQFCPMAFNERGAYWLSTDAEIKNPYFGKKMLECGEVQDSL